jgi:hypothetical protein
MPNRNGIGSNKRIDSYYKRNPNSPGNPFVTQHIKKPKEPEILDLVSLSSDKLKEIFNNDIVWLADQSPTNNKDKTGSTLYIINKIESNQRIVIEKKLTNDFMETTTNGSNKIFKRLHWTINNESNLTIGCWVASGIVTMFNENGDILDNWQDTTQPSAVQTHAAYFTLDNKAILLANMSNCTIYHINIENNSFNSHYSFSITDWIETLSDEEKYKWKGPDNSVGPVRPITVRPFDNSRAGVTLSTGGFLILNFSDIQNMYIEKYYTINQMPGAGLLSYYDAPRKILYVNHGVGTGSTSSKSGASLYYIKGVIFDGVTTWPDETKIIYNRNIGDSHGLLGLKNVLYSVDRTTNVLDVVYLKNKKHYENILYNPEKRKLAMDIIANGKIFNSNKFNLYVSNRGPIPLSGNNPTLGNAVGYKAGISVISSLIKSNGISHQLNYILTVDNIAHKGLRLKHLESDNIDIADCHGLLVLN